MLCSIRYDLHRISVCAQSSVLQLEQVLASYPYVSVLQDIMQTVVKYVYDQARLHHNLHSIPESVHIYRFAILAYDSVAHLLFHSDLSEVDFLL